MILGHNQMNAPALSRKATQTYGRLLAATVDEICEKGTFAAETVAERSGTSTATFYVYFPSKDVALKAAFDAVLLRMMVMVEDELKIEKLLNQGLEEVCREFVGAALGYFRTHSLMFRMALAELPHSKPLRQSYRKAEDKVHGRYVDFITLGQKAGMVKKGDVSAMATTLLVLTQGLNNPIAIGRPSRAVRKGLVDLAYNHLKP